MYDINIKIYARDKSAVLWELGADEVVSYRVDDLPAGEGLPLGAVSSKRFTLVAAAQPGMTPQALDCLYVRALLYDSDRPTAVYENQATWTPFGAWTVSHAEVCENEATITLTGADALSTRFENTFTDSAGSYPQTLRSLVNTLCGAAMGAQVSPERFYNDDYALSRLPAWGEGITLRRALSCCAFLAGSLCRISFDGEAQMISCFGGEELALTPDSYIRFIRQGGEPFSLNAILYRFEGDSQYARFAQDATAVDSAVNCLRSEGNPLMTNANLNALIRHLAGCGFEGGEVHWRGGLVQAGDVITVTDLEGRTHRLLVTESRATFDKDGLSVTSRSSMPTLGAGGGATGARGVFNADGSINFEAIGEVTARVLALSGAYIASLTAGDIQTNGLLAKFIEAARLRASSISAQEVTTDALTAALAEIVNLSVRKIDAGTISADEVTSALMNAFAVKAEQLTAASIDTDRLAAALSRFQVIAAGTAAFDRATVTHLVANALNLSYGVGGEVYIENLAADYASLLNANVGHLCVKAADGNYYELNVDANGAVTAARTTVSAAETESGVTSDGRTILETEIDASLLNASSLKAVRALISRLDAARVDADTLFARQAFIDSLNARDITSNSYLRLALTERDERMEEIASETQNALNAQAESEPFTQNLKRWLTIDEEGLKQGKSGSAYSTLVNESGFHIYRRGQVESAGSFDRMGLSAPGIKIGDIQAIRTARGGWVWREKTD